MKLLAFLTRALLTLATLGALLLLAIAFLFNDTNESAIKLLSIWGGYALVGIILIIVNEIMLRSAKANHSFRRIYGLIWAAIAVVGICAWVISAYFMS
ncbi:hypothetical protein [Paenibacillus sp. CF384]|uniref:hypothetical protein n=1 Tax=Paenibacillus sp. CF384 TaxID=1884382 RepID=UPI00089947D6|nr:hypothetical protein [Paenibacillus sp. CF384]SDX89605.1 hypothetical protein SAMN05518855_102723 [Paenibacillus sp. CF384]